MKRILTLAAMMLLFVQLNAQEQGLAISFGYGQPTLREGDKHNIGNSSPFLSKDGNSLYGLGKTTQLKGFQANLMYEATIVNGFGVAVGMNYTFGLNKTQVVGQGSLGINDEKYNSTTEFHTLDLTVDWQYKIEVATNTYVILYTGPALGFNVGGNTKTQHFDLMHAEWLEQNLNPFSNQKNQGGMYEDNYGDFALRRYNLRWTLGAGFQYKRYFIRGGYDFGLLNEYKNREATLSTGDITDIRCRLDQWQIRIGVFLWQSK